MKDVIEGPRPDDTAPMTMPLHTLGRPPDEARDAPRWWAVLRRIGIFWPTFAISLVVAVVFVATVAYSSMNDVGSPGTVGEQTTTKAGAAVRPSSFVIVQVASATTQATARASATRLRNQGFPKASVLRSDLYRPLNPGYWVVYVGTYPLTRDGRAAAVRDQKRLPAALRADAKIREIHQR